MTPDQLIEKYIALRNKKQAMDAEHEAAIKPYKDGLDKIETIVLGMLNEQKLDNMKSEAGTAYRKTLMTSKVSDRQALVGLVLSNVISALEANQPHDKLIAFFEPFTNAVSKEWVKEYLDTHHAPPPGVAIDHFVSVGFRKA